MALSVGRITRIGRHKATFMNALAAVANWSDIPELDGGHCMSMTVTKSEHTDTGKSRIIEFRKHFEAI